MHIIYLCMCFNIFRGVTKPPPPHSIITEYILNNNAKFTTVIEVHIYKLHVHRIT